MNRLHSIGLLAFCLHAAFSIAQEVKAPVTDEQIRKLIEMLGSGDFDERNEALQSLEKIGNPIRPHVMHALHAATDLELKRNLQYLQMTLKRGDIVFECYDTRGQPLEGVNFSVHLQPQRMINERTSTVADSPIELTSDSRGRAKIGDKDPEIYYLRIQWKEGYTSANTNQNMIVQTGENRLQFVLQKTGTVLGKFVDPTDKPLDGIQIYLKPDDGSEYSTFDLDNLFSQQHLGAQVFSASSDKDGNFKIENVVPGSYLSFSINDKYNSKVGETIYLEEGQALQLAAPMILEPKAPRNGSLFLKIMQENEKVFANGKLWINVLRIPDGEEQKKEEQAFLDRVRRGQINMQRTPETLSDENGQVKIEDLQSGRYYISIHRENGNAIHLNDIVVKPGEITALTIDPPAKRAGLSGVVLDADGSAVRNCYVWAIPENHPHAAAVLKDPLIYSNWFWAFRNQQQGSDGYTNPDNNGRYQMKNLAPGKYTIYIQDYQSQYNGMIFGVDVKGDQTTKVPEIRLNYSKKSRGGADSTITGKVLRPDGQPAESISVRLHFASGSNWGSSTGRNGNFAFSATGHMNNPARLVVNAPGFQPVIMDLSGKAEWKDLTVNLVKQEYGNLLIKVTDREGQLLKDVQIRVGENATTPRGITSENGETLLRGLATGQRTIWADLSGYYCTENPQVTIEANRQHTLEIVMQKGMRLEGTVELKPEIGFERVLAHLFSSEWTGMMSSSVDERGRFIFEGLAPGTYTLSAQYPGMVVEKNAELQIEPDNVPAPPILKLVKPQKLSFDLGRTGRGYSLTFMSSGIWDPANRPESKETGDSISFSLGALDSNGKGRMNAYKTGIFDLQLSPPLPRGPYGQRTVDNTSQASQIIKEVKVEPEKEYRFDVPTYSGSVEGVLEISNLAALDTIFQGIGSNLGSLSLIVVGERSIANVHYNLISNFVRDNKMVYVGSPPFDLTKKPPNMFKISNLPSGQFRLHVEPSLWNYSYGYRRMHKYKPDPRVEQLCRQIARKALKTFTLEEGKHLDLGSIDLELPPDLIELIKEIANQRLDAQLGPKVGEDRDLSQ